MPPVERRLEPDSCSERKHFGKVSRTSILSSPGIDPADAYRPRNPEQSVLYRTIAGKTMARIDPKIRSEHLERKAYVYIRQSSPQQLRDHAATMEFISGTSDAIIGVLNAVFQRWPDPGMMGRAS